MTFFSEQTVHELLCLGFVVQLEGEPGMVVFWNGGLSIGMREAYTLSIEQQEREMWLSVIVSCFVKPRLLCQHDPL